MSHGIICIETEWQITKKSNRITLNSEPLMKFVSEMYGVPYIYRRVATLGELKYYLSQFSKKEYSAKYDILYFSSHGNTHSICLEGEKDEIELNDLLEFGGNVFDSRFVHFSSCRTLLGAGGKDFKERSHAKIVSGYTTSVDSALSAIHDIALFGEYIRGTRFTTIENHLRKNFGGLEEALGFKIIR